MKKPFLHALAAALYILSLVLLVNSTSVLMPKEDNLLMPITMLSLLVLSVSVMAYVFFAEPLHLFMKNQNEEALSFFTKTVGCFAVFVLLFAVSILFF